MENVAIRVIVQRSQIVYAKKVDKRFRKSLDSDESGAPRRGSPSAVSVLRALPEALLKKNKYSDCKKVLLKYRRGNQLARA